MMEKYINLIESNIYEGNPAIDGWCTTEKAKALFNLVAETNPDLVVEVGIFGGKSLLPLAWGCQFNQKGKVIGIDPWCAPAALEGSNSTENDKWWATIDYPSIYSRFVQNVIKHGLLEYTYWYRDYSKNVVGMFADGSIDIFHCDGNHSEEVTMQEIEMYFPKLRTGGYWVADDIAWGSLGKAVEFLRNNCDIVSEVNENGNSWGIYRKK